MSNRQYIKLQFLSHKGHQTFHFKNGSVFEKARNHRAKKKVPVLDKREFEINFYHGLKATTLPNYKWTHILRWGCRGRPWLSDQQLPSLLNYHSHCSPPTPTRYLEAATVRMCPLAMVGTFPKQTDQCFKNFSNRERGSSDSPAGENRK